MQMCIRDRNYTARKRALFGVPEWRAFSGSIISRGTEQYTDTTKIIGKNKMCIRDRDIWYATNIEIVDYMKAAKNLKYTVNCDKVYNPNALDVWIAADGEIYRVGAGKTVNIAGA